MAAATVLENTDSGVSPSSAGGYNQTQSDIIAGSQETSDEEPLQSSYGDENIQCGQSKRPMYLEDKVVHDKEECNDVSDTFIEDTWEECKRICSTFHKEKLPPSVLCRIKGKFGECSHPYTSLKNDSFPFSDYVVIASIGTEEDASYALKIAHVVNRYLLKVGNKTGVFMYSPEKDENDANLGKSCMGDILMLSRPIYSECRRCVLSVRETMNHYERIMLSVVTCSYTAQDIPAFVDVGCVKDGILEDSCRRDFSLQRIFHYFDDPIAEMMECDFFDEKSGINHNFLNEFSHNALKTIDGFPDCRSKSLIMSIQRGKARHGPQNGSLSTELTDYNCTSHIIENMTRLRCEKFFELFLSRGSRDAYRYLTNHSDHQSASM